MGGLAMAHENDTPITISLCVDCYYLIGAGMPADPDPAWDPTALDDREITLGTFHDCPDRDTCECDTESYFSWQPCGGCHSTLGGERYDATEWIRA